MQILKIQTNADSKRKHHARWTRPTITGSARATFSTTRFALAPKRRSMWPLFFSMGESRLSSWIQMISISNRIHSGSWPGWIPKSANPRHRETFQPCTWRSTATAWTFGMFWQNVSRCRTRRSSTRWTGSSVSIIFYFCLFCRRRTIWTGQYGHMDNMNRLIKSGFEEGDEVFKVFNELLSSFPVELVLQIRIKNTLCKK